MDSKSWRIGQWVTGTDNRVDYRIQHLTMAKLALDWCLLQERQGSEGIAVYRQVFAHAFEACKRVEVAHRTLLDDLGADVF